MIRHPLSAIGYPPPRAGDRLRMDDGAGRLEGG